jgi:hypothetical protein
MRVATVALLLTVSLLITPGVSRADSYADAVVAFSPVIQAGQPTDPHLEPGNAVAAPDYDGVTNCPSTEACTFVSLGDGGSITLQFVDNALTGSDNDDPDLWIYEIGPDVEDTFVEISSDNTTWHAVGKVFGSTSTVDIDAYGFTTADMFTYIRLTDDGNEGGQSGNTVGADIDAVEALTTIPVPAETSSWGVIKARY